MAAPIHLLDTHAFYGRTNVYNKHSNVPLEFRLEDFRRIQEQNPEYDIRFLIIPALPENNRYIADVVGNNRDLFDGAYLHIVPTENHFLNQTQISEIEELIEDKGIIGGKIIPPLYERSINDPILDDYIMPFTQRGLPILVHCSGSKSEYDSPHRKYGLLKRHPYQKFIFAHLGGLNISKIMETVSLAEQFENLYMNTTGISGELRRIGFDRGKGKLYVKKHEKNSRIMKEAEQIILDIFQRIPNRILFGTDSPFLQFDISPFNRLPGEVMMKMDDNARELFFIK